MPDEDIGYGSSYGSAYGREVDGADDSIPVSSYGLGRLGQGRINDTRHGHTRDLEVEVELTGEIETGDHVRAQSLIEFYPELLEHIEPRRWGLTERERIEGYLKPPFESTRVNEGYDNTEFGELVEVFAQFADTIRAIRIAMLAERHLPHARGRQLDEIGREIFVRRWDGERDSSYRARLMAEYRLLSSAGTIDDVIGGVSALLGIDRSEIEFEEPFDETIAAFTLYVESEDVEDSSVDMDYLEGYVDRIRAAGVRGRILRRGNFEFRSSEHADEDPDDEEHGSERGWGAGRWTG